MNHKAFNDQIEALLDQYRQDCDEFAWEDRKLTNRTSSMVAAIVDLVMKRVDSLLDTQRRACDMLEKPRHKRSRFVQDNPPPAAETTDRGPEKLRQDLILELQKSGAHVKWPTVERFNEIHRPDGYVRWTLRTMYGLWRLTDQELTYIIFHARGIQEQRANARAPDGKSDLREKADQAKPTETPPAPVYHPGDPGLNHLVDLCNRLSGMSNEELCMVQGHCAGILRARSREKAD